MRSVFGNLGLICAVLATIASGAAVPVQAGDLLVNGGFEQPAFSGNGDLWSDGGLTNLPGWSFPSSNLALEYGTGVYPYIDPVNGNTTAAVPRYHSGTQSVWLNYDGSKLAPLSQTFSTTEGSSYLLTFALGEVNVNHPNPSPTTLLVEAGTLIQQFQLGIGGTPSNNGYFIYSASFTATSASTTLSFWDATNFDGRYESPFLDDVSVTSPVPEPSSVALLSLGAIGLAGGAYQPPTSGGCRLIHRFDEWN